MSHLNYVKKIIVGKSQHGESMWPYQDYFLLPVGGATV